MGRGLRPLRRFPVRTGFMEGTDNANTWSILSVSSQGSMNAAKDTGPDSPNELRCITNYVE